MRTIQDVTNATVGFLGRFLLWGLIIGFCVMMIIQVGPYVVAAWEKAMKEARKAAEAAPSQPASPTPSAASKPEVRRNPNYPPQQPPSSYNIDRPELRRQYPPLRVREQPVARERNRWSTRKEDNGWEYEMHLEVNLPMQKKDERHKRNEERSH